MPAAWSLKFAFDHLPAQPYARRMKSLALCCVALLACDNTKEAKRFLQDNGYGEIVVTPTAGDQVDFTAKNASGQRCRGTIDVEDEENSSHSAICAWECTKTDWKNCFARAQLEEKSAAANAVADYAIGCEAGDGASCARAGAITTNLGQAFDFDKKACDLGDAQGCARLAIAYEQGIGTSKDPALAVHAADIACARKVMPACKTSGVALLTGAGAPRDVIAGVDHLDKACTSGESFPACTALGAALVEGRYVPKDLARGHHLLRLSCFKNDAPACLALGQFVRDRKVVDPDGETAAQWFKRGCDLGDALSCKSAPR
jgi:TPR repeat protein